MIRTIVSLGIMVIASGLPVAAQEVCRAPMAPALPDGAKATRGDIVAAQNDLKIFAAASDAFQACLSRELGRQKDLAKQNNVAFDPVIQADLEAKGAAQRQDAVQLATAWGVTVRAFNAAQVQRQQQQPDMQADEPPPPPRPPMMGNY